MMETIRVMQFWFNQSDKNNYLEEIKVAAKNIDHLSCMTSNNKYLKSLETTTELNFCTEELKFKLSIYFDIKRCLQFKRISYLLIIDCFL